ncbi:MAG TPA: glycosyltransferase [Kiritimatiellia bacterium]|jgi:glycosyltransferase involved in cell wall biosynthesis|nr:glycosyltransferase [Kiritimatiellia bacterium]MBP9571944.1 glycosyltransferase [Kiritimatiellia bacterium]HOR74907.1 glycosyltransferase [Kiritimatiellia bacterium]HQF21676.1 glycosyltransferase [Kiritimatiellia bacterium]HQG75778.1 glycosyltransferase [Kiritimatiellia bacterium]
MNLTAVHQLVAGFAAGDAISLEAVAIREACRALGYASDIFAPAESVTPDTRHDVRPLEELPSVATQALIYHYSIQSRATDVFRRAAARKVMIYHNITPAEYFRGFDEAVERQLTLGRQELGSIAALADAVWADSAFNAQELAALGVQNVRVLPLLFSPTMLEVAPDSAIQQRLATPSKKILFVGRIAPNKCVEDLIEVFAWYHRHLERRSELLVVGSERSCPRYFAMLRMYTGELDLPAVSFVRYASPAGLVAFYEGADLFVTTSRHEGYCLPVVEAMYKSVPVLARNVGGVPEAMDGAGVMFDDASPMELACLMHRLITPGPLRSTVLAAQQARIERLRARPVLQELRELLTAL